MQSMVNRRQQTSNGICLLFLHSAEPPPLEGWQESLALMREAETDLKGDLSRFSMLVVTDGGAPTGEMRNSFVGWLNKRTVPIAVISDSPMARGVVTAISWFNPKIKAFSPSRWQDALSHAGVIADQGSEFLEEFKQMEKKLGTPCGALAKVRRAAGDIMSQTG